MASVCSRSHVSPTIIPPIADKTLNLKPWLPLDPSLSVASRSDADTDILSDYVLALMKADLPEPELEKVRLPLVQVSGESFRLTQLSCFLPLFIPSFYRVAFLAKPYDNESGPCRAAH